MRWCLSNERVWIVLRDAGPSGGAGGRYINDRGSCETIFSENYHVPVEGVAYALNHTWPSLRAQGRDAIGQRRWERLV